MNDEKKWKLLVMFAIMAIGCGEVTDPSPFELDEPVDEPVDESEMVTSEPVPAPVAMEPTPQPSLPDRPEVKLQPIRCASDFVSGDGSYYAVDVAPADNDWLVEVFLVRLARVADTGFGAEPAEPASAELVWSSIVSDLSGSGAETVMSLSIEPTERLGLHVGSISGESEFELHEGGIPLTCWDDELQLPASYDENTGDCIDDSGALSRNMMPFAFVVDSGFGECGVFSGLLNGAAALYPSFSGLNLRGADLSASTLAFAHFIDADLRGADLSTFSFSYSTVRGRIDEHTVLPETRCDSPVDGDAFDCTQ